MQTEIDRTSVFVSRLINEYHYPSKDIRREVPYAFGKARYRLDLLVMKKGKPYIVVEIKTRRLLQSAMNQLLDYTRAVDAEFAVVTDGYIDHCYKIVRDAYETHLKSIPDIPSYGRALEEIGIHPNSELVTLGPKQLHELILHIIDFIQSNQGVSKDQASREVLKLLILKIHDEAAEESLFRAHYEEPPENIKSRISALVMEAARNYPTILKDPPSLDPKLLSTIVHELQKYSLKNSGTGIVGSKLPVEEVLGIRSYEFSTPRNLIKLMIDFLNPTEGSTFIDPACGVGGILTEAAIRGCKVTGIDINPSVTQYAKANLVLSGLPGNVFTQDSLKSIQKLARVDIPNDGFDYAAVVPPFGRRIGNERLHNFFLGMQRRSQSIEVLFLERTLWLLKPGGKMCIVIPEGFLFSASAYDVREFILKTSIVKAIISLPRTMFSPFSSVKTSLLLLEHSPKRGTTEDDEIFTAIIDDMEHFESVVSSFKAFLDKGIVPRKENLFITNVTSANQMDAGYLKGLRSISHWENQYQHTELQEIVNLTTGVRLDRIGKETPEGDFWYVRAGNVRDLILDLGENERIKTNVNVSKWLAEPGDILMTRTGTVGRVALVQEDSPPIVVGSNVVKMSIRDKSRMPPEYLLAYLRSKHGQTQIGMYTGGSAIQAINISGLRRIKIRVPPVEQQRKVVSQVREVIKTKHETNRVLQELRLKEEKLIQKLDNLILGD